MQITSEDEDVFQKKTSSSKSKFQSEDFDESIFNKAETTGTTPESPRKSILLHLENKRKSSTCNVLSDL